jgi:hypothetical protein
MLLAHLWSITRSHPAARATIYWQDIPADRVGALQAAFPSFDFRETQFDFSGHWVRRIAAKMRSWSRAVVEHEGKDQLVLADADTLIVRDLSSFFSDAAADVIFTWKPENVPVNTGVMLVKSGAAATAFFRRLEERTVEILETPALYAQANDPALGYGAADQMALMQLVGFEREKTGYAIDVAGVPIQLRAVPCSRLNETNSRPLSDEIHVIHYKGGWQPILLQGRPFSRFRTRAESWEMFALYLRTFSEALEHLNSRASTSWTARDFGIVVPFYFRAATGGFDSLLYAAWRVKEAAKRAALLLRGAPLPDSPR